MVALSRRVPEASSSDDFESRLLNAAEAIPGGSKSVLSL